MTTLTHPDSYYELLFVLAGMMWIGAGLVAFSLYHFIKKFLKVLFSPLPQKEVPTPGRWTRDWESIQNNLNK